LTLPCHSFNLIACSASEILAFLGLVCTPAFLAVLRQSFDDLSRLGILDPQLLANLSLEEHAAEAALCLDWLSYAPDRCPAESGSRLPMQAKI
jgi:hypothetical protein